MSKSPCLPTQSVTQSHRDWAKMCRSARDSEFRSPAYYCVSSVDTDDSQRTVKYYSTGMQNVMLVYFVMPRASNLPLVW